MRRNGRAPGERHCDSRAEFELPCGGRGDGQGQKRIVLRFGRPEGVKANIFSDAGIVSHGAQVMDGQGRIEFHL